MTLKEIATYLGGYVVGDDSIFIAGPAKIESAKEGEITFLSSLKYKHFLTSTQASAVIVDTKQENLTLAQIVVPNAYVAFVLVLKLFEPQSHSYIQGISDQAFVHPTAIVDPDVHIAPLAYIGPNVKIGSGTVIYPNVSLLADVQVGQDCIIYPNVSIREHCRIGSRVILQNGCVIGSDGFGHAPHEGAYIKIPQIGNVIIEDDVEVGANTTIDRATLGSTIVKEGTKLDNLVQIAHNVVVGPHTVMAAQSGIAGSTELGEHITIGGQAAITGHIKIGKNAIIAAQSGVTKNLDENAVVWGTPALPLRQRKKIDVSLKYLPDLLKRVQKLEDEIHKHNKHTYNETDGD